MWSESITEAQDRSDQPDASRRADAALPEYPDQETVDFYMAKANAMRARQYRWALSWCWRVMRRAVRRQLSPCRKVKLPPTTA